MIIGLVGFTYPSYVKELKNKGDDTLKKVFDCTENAEKYVFYSNPTLRQIKKVGETIHGYYEVDIQKEKYGTQIKRGDGFYVISEDDGKTWFFLTKEIYDNPNECKNLSRLLTN